MLVLSEDRTALSSKSLVKTHYQVKRVYSLMHTLSATWMNTFMDCEFPGAIENKFKFPEVMLIRFELLYEHGNPLELDNGISRFILF